MKKHFLVALLCSSFELLFGQWNVVGNALTQNGTWPLLSIAADKIGNVYAVGAYSVNPTKTYVAKWDGLNWDTLGNLSALSGSRFLNCVHVDKWNTVYASNVYSGLNYNELAKFDGSAWAVVGGTNSLNPNGTINSIASDTMGNIFVAGAFTNNSGQPYVAKWNGSVWSELVGLSRWVPSGLGISDICTDKSGNVYAVGDFTNAAGLYYVAKWNGTGWMQLAGSNALNLTHRINRVFCDRYDNLYAVGCYNAMNGYTYIAKWNGSAWSELGDISAFTKGQALQTACIDSKGNIYTATSQSSLPNIFSAIKWNGSNWSIMKGANACLQMKGSSSTNILSLTVDNLDNLYALGGVTNANCDFIVVKYDQPYLLGTPPITAEKKELSVSPNPAHHNITIKANSNLKCDLDFLDRLGQSVLTFENVLSNDEIDISNLSSGIYFLRIQTEGFQKTMKIVKE